MIKTIIKSGFFVVLLIAVSGLYAQNQYTDWEKVEEAYNNGDPLALGIVLSFESRWPNKAEE